MNNKIIAFNKHNILNNVIEDQNTSLIINAIISEIKKNPEFLKLIISEAVTNNPFLVLTIIEQTTKAFEKQKDYIIKAAYDTFKLIYTLNDSRIEQLKQKFPPETLLKQFISVSYKPETTLLAVNFF